MEKQYTVIRFTQVLRQGRRIVQRRPVWVRAVSFAPGPGMKVRGVKLTPDLAKAERFGLLTAHDIAVQFSERPASLERPDGTPLLEATERLQVEQRARHAAAIRNMADIRREWAEALEEIAPLLRKAIENNP